MPLEIHPSGGMGGAGKFCTLPWDKEADTDLG